MHFDKRASPEAYHKDRMSKNPLVYGSIAVLLAALYTGWTFASRWEQNRRIELRAQARKAAEDRRVLALYGSSALKISQFYAFPAEIRRGEKAQLCYSVLNARAVRTEPALAYIYPAFSHCVEITPEKTTTYTLQAEGKDGSKAEQSATVVVK